MKKMFLILVTAIGLGITANAQDIILKQDGSEIVAKVLEITDQQVKYKEFDFQSGPIRNINKSEVFMITYENGKREIFNNPNETNASPSKQQNVTNCTKKTAFGLDIGTGGSFYTVPNEKSETLFASALGIRVTHHFNPYFGVDFLKVNWIVDVLEDFWTMRLQFMPGVRGNSPTFFKCMSVYSAFRLGYGMDFRLLGFSGASHFEGLCLETELGLNLTPTVFAGFAYNYHKYFVGGVDSKLAMHTLSFRLGFNFGRIQEAKTERAKAEVERAIIEAEIAKIEAKTEIERAKAAEKAEKEKSKRAKAEAEAEAERAKEERAKIEAEKAEAERKKEQQLTEAKKELPYNLLRWIKLRYPQNKYFYTEISYLEEPDFVNEGKVYRIKLQREKNEVDNATVWFTRNGNFLKVEDTFRTEEEIEEEAKNALLYDYYYKVGTVKAKVKKEKNK